MSKLDWSRAGNVQHDPARVQRVADFVTPDKAVVSIRSLTRAEISELKAVKVKRDPATDARRAKRIASRKASQGQRLAARALNRATQKEAAKLKAERSESLKLAQEKRRHRMALKEAVELARKQTPEYLAAQKIEEERVAAAEQVRKQTLRHEREPLRQLWREKLLTRQDTST